MNNTWNGHHTVKVEGDTLYRGEIQALPMPDHFPTVEEAVEALFDVGYVVFPGVLNCGEVATLRARMDAMGSQNDEDYVVPGWCYNKQIGSDFSQNPDLLDYIDRPGVIEVVDVIHGGDAHLGVNPGAQVIGGSSWITGQGRAMGIHTDYQSYGLPPEVHEKYRLPIYCTTLHYYLNGMRLDLGPTTVIPGSHRAGRHPVNESTWNGTAPLAAIVGAGDAVLFRNDLWHGAAKNEHPTERRYMMQVHYAHGSFGKQYPSLRWPQLYNPAVLEKATSRQRRLLGDKEPKKTQCNRSPRRQCFQTPLSCEAGEGKGGKTNRQAALLTISDPPLPSEGEGPGVRGFLVWKRSEQSQPGQCAKKTPCRPRHKVAEDQAQEKR